MPKDLRQYMRQTNTRLILGGIVLLFLVGDGLIYLFYGQYAAVMGLLCIGAGLVPILLIILYLALMEWILKISNRNQ